MQSLQRHHEGVDGDVVDACEIAFELLAVGAVRIREDVELSGATALDGLDRVFDRKRADIEPARLLCLGGRQIGLRLHIEEATEKEVAPGAIGIGNVLPHHHFKDTGHRGRVDFLEGGGRIQARESGEHRRISSNGSTGGNRVLRLHACCKAQQCCAKKVSDLHGFLFEVRCLLALD